MVDSLEHDPANYSGAARAFLEVIENFRDVAIENDRGDATSGEPLDTINQHYTGPIDPRELGATPNFPVAWTVPLGYTPGYNTTASDQGQLNFQVVIWTADQSQPYALEEALILVLEVVDNLEADPTLSTGSNAISVQNSEWTNLDLDFAPAAADGELAQVKWALADFEVTPKRTGIWG